MTDDELRLMLDWRPSQIPFEQLPADWKAWATAMIESAKVPANKHAHMRLEDSVLYLCRVLRVFGDLGGGMTEDDLRGKFVSGLVLSGLPPERDCSFYFGEALPAAERRGLVSHEDRGWGREEVRLYKLTLAGQRFATDVEPVQWVVPGDKESVGATTKSGEGTPMTEAPGQLSGTVEAGQPAEAANTSMTTARKPKKSTQRGEARTKLISALTAHHGYSNGSFLKWEPVNSNELAQQAQVAKPSATNFFNWAFKPKGATKDATGYQIYKAYCNRDHGSLLKVLRVINDEFAPAELALARFPDDNGD